ncbi:MAG: hypothetical protein QF805_12565, partial [Pirellulaceae bacterium]|nr:hypothetical protein [Pirellulaceae bacterium]
MLARNHLFFAVTVAAVGHSGCSLPFTDQLGDAALPLRDLAPPTAEQRRLAQRIERRLSEKVVLHDRSEHVLIDGWRRSKSSHGRYQWRHRGLQGLHPELAEQLADAAGFENRVTAASVKVALARRAESPRGLTGIIKDGELPINVRRAAAETLGRLDGTRDSVRKLLAVYRDESTAGETALLYEELLRAAVRSGVEL